MKLFEMEGFLRGKCLPGDMKVNETNAEYLVRKFSEAEAKYAALAAENAGLKEYLAPVGLVVEGTPATDAFLAEVRAQGVEMFAKEMHADISGDDAREFAAQLRKGVQS